jgi:hypothetical protein
MRWNRIKQQSKEAQLPVRRPAAQDPSERSRQLACQKDAANNSAAPHEAEKDEGRAAGAGEEQGARLGCDRAKGRGRETSQTRKEAKQFDLPAWLLFPVDSSSALILID